MVVRSLINARKWLIFAKLFQLNIKYYQFHPSLLNDINEIREKSNFRISRVELGFAQYWNARLSDVVSLLGADYTLCMKRCFVLALLLDNEKPFTYVIGVNPGDYKDGHAWLMVDGEIATHYPCGSSYQILKTLNIIS